MNCLARHYETGELLRLTFRGESLIAIEPREQGEPLPVPDADALPLLAPGFIDPQVNGWGGVWFGQPELSPADFARVLDNFPPQGVTRLFPTLITNSQERLRQGLRTIATACEEDRSVANLVAGIHLEGPFVSSEDGPRGAHPREHVRPADWEEFERLQEAAGGRIRLVTLAPEVHGGIAFIRRAVAAGVTVAVGHTTAEPETITAAADAGAALSTHLGNGVAGQLPRHPNLLWEQLAEDRLAASIICDGHHLPASVVRCILRCKPPGRVMLTSDASGDAGRPPGWHRSGAGGEVEVLADGRIVVAGQRRYLAGSNVGLAQCISGVMRLADVPLSTAIGMATASPAQLLRLDDPSLQVGSRFDVVLFHMEPAGIKIEATIVAGTLRFGTVLGR